MKAFSRCNVSCWTYPVAYYYRRMVPGWFCTRQWGKVFNLPPGVEKHFGLKALNLFYSKASPSQSKAFKQRHEFSFIGKRRSVSEPGVYWDGKRGFTVNDFTETVYALGVLDTPSGFRTALKISGLVKGKKYSYLLVAETELEPGNFYKYLLFYRGKISKKILEGMDWIDDLIPYPNDVRLNLCSSTNFTRI